MEIQASAIPPIVSRITAYLEHAGFEAWIVGGCVRDLMLGRKPKDWDITTNATPEEIQGLFANTFYTNEFGTVGVVNEDEQDETLKVVEITTYRSEGTYSDARRPDSVSFSKDIAEDLKRRDFTINALAYSPSSGTVLDLYKGTEDMQEGIIRAVGVARDRFMEDALRIMRAIRLAAELDFTIEPQTRVAMAESASQLGKIAKERIRDEFVRIVNADKPMKALYMAKDTGLLPYIVPELERGMGVEQNQAHKYDVFEHNLRSLQHAADKGWSFDVRLAALFHDIGKPAARRWSDDKKDWTFHGHEVVGARMTKKHLEALKFPKEVIDRTEKLVRWHMFFSDPDKITLSAVRRIVTHVGRENIENLVQLRICDRIGTGRPKEQPFRLRKYQAMIEQALHDPISVGMLAVNGGEIMELFGEKPGPRIGWMLHALLEEVLDDAARNTKEYLHGRLRELVTFSDEQLETLGRGGRERKEAAEEEIIKDIEKKYHVA